MFFNQNEMIRSGSYRGIPLYSLKTAEPYAVLYVPMDRAADAAVRTPARGRDRRNRRQHRAVISGPSRSCEAMDRTAGSRHRARRWLASGRRPTMSPTPDPVGRGTGWHDRGDDESSDRPAHDGAQADGAQRVLHQLRGAALVQQRQGSGARGREFTRTGDYHGFPVYSSSDAQSDTIYVAVAGVAGGLLTPYSTRR